MGDNCVRKLLGWAISVADGWTEFDKSSTIGSQTLEGTEMLKLAEQPYQLLPELPSWEYHALKESIRRHGVLLPVIKDDLARPSTVTTENVRVGNLGSPTTRSSPCMG